jgi:hypothetical protein
MSHDKAAMDQYIQVGFDINGMKELFSKFAKPGSKVFCTFDGDSIHENDEHLDIQIDNYLTFLLTGCQLFEIFEVILQVCTFIIK